MWMLWQDKLMDKSDVRVSPDDRGYVFGDGVYEVFRIYGGKLFEKEAHLERLFRSAEGTRIKLPYGKDELTAMLERLVLQEGTIDGTLYMQVTRGAAPRAHPFPADA